jgi:hypothetical protein
VIEQDLSKSLDSFLALVSGMSDSQLQECSDIIERALVHFLVEQHLRSPGVSASLLTS